MNWSEFWIRKNILANKNVVKKFENVNDLSPVFHRVKEKSKFKYLLSYDHNFYYYIDTYLFMYWETSFTVI